MASHLDNIMKWDQTTILWMDVCTCVFMYIIIHNYYIGKLIVIYTGTYCICISLCTYM